MSQKPTLLIILSAAMVLVSLSGCISDSEDPHAPHGSEHEDDQESDTGSIPDGGANETAEGAANNTTGSLPTATLTATLDNDTAPANASFEVAGSDADGDALSWTLDWDGDGTIDDNGTALPATVTVTFDEAGNYTALLQVTDKDGTANATANITIVAPVDDDNGVCHRPDALSVGPLWIDDRTGGEPDLNHWVYLESNDIPGLQVGGEGESEEYADCVNPDTLVF